MAKKLDPAELVSFKELLMANSIQIDALTYFAAVSADLKALIERAGYVAYANNHAFSGKIGVAVVAVRRGGATHAYETKFEAFKRQYPKLFALNAEGSAEAFSREALSENY